MSVMITDALREMIAERGRALMDLGAKVVEEREALRRAIDACSGSEDDAEYEATGILWGFYTEARRLAEAVVPEDG
jgi:hypothetical protein